MSRLCMAAALTLLLGLAGCQHYSVEVKLEADGSGRRVCELACDAPGPTPEASLSHFKEGFCLGEAAGWRRIKRDEEPQRLVFKREQRLARPADWARLDGEIAIPGRPGTDAADVLFTNTVAVETASADGVRSLSYRERFDWRGILPAASALIAELGEAALAAQYPELDASERAELRGLLTGAALRYIVLEQEDAGEPAYQTFLGALAEEARLIIVRRYPQAEPAAITACLHGVLRGAGEQGDAVFAERLPGLDLVATTDLNFRLTLPGPVLETNADRVEGNVAIWQFSLSDALLEPVQVYAKVRIRN